jgi:hypothetical protein
VSVTVLGLLVPPVVGSGLADGAAVRDDDAAWEAGALTVGDPLTAGDPVTAVAAWEGACDGGLAGCEPDANPVTLISTRQVSAARVRSATARGSRRRRIRIGTSVTVGGGPIGATLGTGRALSPCARRSSRSRPA